MSDKASAQDTHKEERTNKTKQSDIDECCNATRNTSKVSENRFSNTSDPMVRARKSEDAPLVCEPPSFAKDPYRQFIIDSGSSANVVDHDIVIEQQRDYV